MRREAPWPLLAATLTRSGRSARDRDRADRAPRLGDRARGELTPRDQTGNNQTQAGGRTNLTRLVPGPVPPPGTIASEIPPWLPTRRRGAGRVDPLPPAAPPRHLHWCLIGGQGPAKGLASPLEPIPSDGGIQRGRNGWGSARSATIRPGDFPSEYESGVQTSSAHPCSARNGFGATSSLQIRPRRGARSRLGAGAQRSRRTRCRMPPFWK